MTEIKMREYLEFTGLEVIEVQKIDGVFHNKVKDEGKMGTMKTMHQLLKELSDTGFTGQIRLNFYEGNISEKIEKKESFKV